MKYLAKITHENHDGLGAVEATIYLQDRFGSALVGEVTLYPSADGYQAWGDEWADHGVAAHVLAVDGALSAIEAAVTEEMQRGNATAGDVDAKVLKWIDGMPFFLPPSAEEDAQQR